jgi:FdhE protein
MGQISQDAWLESHPYLRPVADFHAQVAAAAADIPVAAVFLPDLDNYLGDYQAGIPLLRSSHVSINFEAAASMVVSLVESLCSKLLPEKLAEERRVLDAQLRSAFDAPHRAVAWLLGNNAFVPAHPGLLRYLGWTALARYLGPLVDAYSRWRDEDRWLRSYCPTCGCGPSMSQLVGIDPGRQRFLSCGCCGTRWRFRRIGCPFCETPDAQRLAVLAIEGERSLRIDYCESCGAYLKTYNGEGSEVLMLADWTSLHVDLIASDRGLKRLASSLYEF